MNNKFDFSEATIATLDFLKNNFSYQYVTLRHYRTRWQSVKEYADSQKIDFISTEVCNDFIVKFYNGRNRSDLSVNEKNIEKAVAVLSEFIATGTIKRKYKTIHLDGSIGMLVKDFLSLKKSLRRSNLTIEKIETHLSNFNFWLLSHGVSTVLDIKPTHIISFIKSMDSTKRALVYSSLLHLRSFFNYLYERDLIPVNLTSFVPRDNYIRQSQLPSYYTEGEIDQLLKSVDRGTAVGKRDYAILLLASHLGLRVSDIARLKFDNLHWETSTIVFIQYKTGKDQVLPLLPVIGNAILDYIQYARPQSNEKNIFILAISPFIPMTSNSISTMVHRRFMDSNMDIRKRRHGAHALRHSLVKELLNNNQSLPVITEVLGHKNTESARNYIRIDTESLRQCALNVPLVDPLFYQQQNGGFWYE
jgi:site-specific recombinase XerD